MPSHGRCVRVRSEADRAVPMRPGWCIKLRQLRAKTKTKGSPGCKDLSSAGRPVSNEMMIASYYDLLLQRYQNQYRTFAARQGTHRLAKYRSLRARMICYFHRMPRRVTSSE